MDALKKNRDKLGIGVSGPVNLDGELKAKAEELFGVKPDSSDLPSVMLYFRIVNPTNCALERGEVLFKSDDLDRFAAAQTLIGNQVEEGCAIALKFLGHRLPPALPKEPGDSTRESIDKTLKE